MGGNCWVNFKEIHGWIVSDLGLSKIRELHRKNELLYFKWSIWNQFITGIVLGSYQQVEIYCLGVHFTHVKYFQTILIHRVILTFDVFSGFDSFTETESIHRTVYSWIQTIASKGFHKDLIQNCLHRPLKCSRIYLGLLSLHIGP